MDEVICKQYICVWLLFMHFFPKHLYALYVCTVLIYINIDGMHMNLMFLRFLWKYQDLNRN